MIAVKGEDWLKLYQAIRGLIETMPTFEGVSSRQLNNDEHLWIGRLNAVVRNMNNAALSIDVQWAGQYITDARGYSASIEKFRSVLFRALAESELNATGINSSDFIAAGNKFDAISAVSRILKSAKKEVLFIDPYADASIITDFAALAQEGLHISILTDKSSVKPSLAPVAKHWRSQYDIARPLEVRVAPERSLHDRAIIIDNDDAFVVTQSFKDLADRSPASFSKLDREAANLKIVHYQDVWSAAELLE